MVGRIGAKAKVDYTSLWEISAVALAEASDNKGRETSLSTTLVTANRYRPEMDGLRAVACLIVLIGHAIAINYPPASKYVAGIPKIGVWLFFVLSAYLLTMRLIEGGLTGRNIAFYGVSRFLRIAPLFIVAVGFYLIAGTLGINTIGDALAVATLQRSAGHLWTIPVEVGFYVILPVVLLAMVAIGRGSNYRGMTALAVLVAAAVLFWPPNLTPESSTSPVWYAVNFGAGIAAGFLTASGLRIQISKWLPIGALAIVVAIVAVNKAGLHGDLANWLMNKHYVFGPLLAVVAFGIYGGRGLLTRAMACRPLVLVGKASFSIYLFHWAICQWMRPLPAAVGIPLAITASIGVGLVSFAVLERPLYDLRKVFRPRPTALAV